MKGFRRWAAAALAAALTAVSLTFSLALPAETSFAGFLIDASSRDVHERTISVIRRLPDENGIFQPSEAEDCTCKLNRVTGDASFFVQPTTDGVWMTVDYLADLDGDGSFELLDGPQSPMRDVFGKEESEADHPAEEGQTSLLVPQETETPPLLNNGETYILSSELLVNRHRLAVQNGTQLLELEPLPQQDYPLCMVSLHCTNSSGEELEQIYYLTIYNEVLVPFDLSRDQWYYDAVLFGLSQGYFSGVGDGLFLPEQQLNRAQMAQVLWTMSGCPEAETQTQFEDVHPSDWFSSSISWCQKEGLITGYDAVSFGPYDPLSREQMIVILHRYARHTGSSLRANANMARFTDRAEISSWAYDSMRWAVTNRLITPTDNNLQPHTIVSRGELAAVLYAYSLNLTPKNLW